MGSVLQVARARSLARIMTLSGDITSSRKPADDSRRKARDRGFKSHRARHILCPGPDSPCASALCDRTMSNYQIPLHMPYPISVG